MVPEALSSSLFFPLANLASWRLNSPIRAATLGSSGFLSGVPAPIPMI